MKTSPYIPTRLDDIWKIGLWDVDVASPVLIAFLLGYASNTKLGFIGWLAVGIAVSRKLARLKADKHEAFALHWAYWHFPTSPLTSMRATPPSDLQRMVG
ncbi:type IV conjugative transfer system protein TraL [Massilia sp. TS11]|uniref:type IV conjugative transfer system protein TraL n=1 Tax=Massilia sp. TS11 TaxID=2908003 RepID=UPI001EDAB407|nr:type IV conjugative transfer system protein TraL [Massilia sp. TS11]MCG2583893.1 type IV conjugative transfer system protein TraL [Massilia sp. TS11]